MPVWEIPKAPAAWVAKMSRYLPYHQDRYFTLLGASMWGGYKLQYKPEEPEGGTVKVEAQRELDRFSRGADGAVKQYQLKKAMRAKRGR